MSPISDLITHLLSDPWYLVGFGGQFLFMMRFVVQWVHSEKRKQSVIPVAFWFFSLGGGAVLLCYAIYKRDPVFILGQGLGLIIYVRNLFLIYQSRASHKQKKTAQQLVEELLNDYSGDAVLSDRLTELKTLIRK